MLDSESLNWTKKKIFPFIYLTRSTEQFLRKIMERVRIYSKAVPIHLLNSIP
jgi:hypothetical protein